MNSSSPAHDFAGICNACTGPLDGLGEGTPYYAALRPRPPAQAGGGGALSGANAEPAGQWGPCGPWPSDVGEEVDANQVDAVGADGVYTPRGQLTRARGLVDRVDQHLESGRLDLGNLRAVEMFVARM